MNDANQVEVRAIRGEDLSDATKVFFESWLGLMKTLGYERRGLDPKRGFKPTHVACVDGVIVGVMSIQGNELEQLYVSPKYQGLGIGERLLTLALELGVTMLKVDEGNVGARRFYDQHGFINTGIKECGVRFPEHSILIYRLNTG